MKQLICELQRTACTPRGSVAGDLEPTPRYYYAMGGGDTPQLGSLGYGSYLRDNLNSACATPTCKISETQPVH
jgi:hypothetical protein